MVASPKGLGPENDCAGEVQQQLQKTDPVLSSEREPHINKSAIVRQYYRSDRKPQVGALFQERLAD
jgi:hypothetical protein